MYVFVRVKMYICECMGFFECFMLVAVYVTVKKNITISCFRREFL